MQSGGGRKIPTLTIPDDPMSILLRDVETGLFYEGPRQWTPQRSQAFDFEDVVRALETATRPGLNSVEVVINCSEDQGDLLLPVKETAPADFLFFVQNWAVAA